MLDNVGALVDTCKLFLRTVSMSSTSVGVPTNGSNSEPERTTSDQSSDEELRDKGFPPQRHAGAVGLGPEYAMGASVSEKLEGLKEEIKGKITKRPNLVEHGRELRTGELKRKVRAQADTHDPFATPDDQK